MRLGLGSVIPADGTIVASRNLSVNEAVLTGESLPKYKKEGEIIYSGSFVATGNLEAEVVTTGKNTNFGKTIFSIERSTQKSILETDILNITRFLTAISLAAVVLLTIVFLCRGALPQDLLTLDISLMIAGIPIALPAVMAIILSIGAAGLAKKMVVIRRLSALENLANVNLLLTDKTGTLTKNEISVSKVVSYQAGLGPDDVIELASYAAATDTPDAIDSAVIKKFKETGRQSTDIRIVDFVPYDSDRKRSTVCADNGSHKILVSVGAPQVIKSLVEFPSVESARQYETDIEQAAANGFRVLAVAAKNDGSQEARMNMAGLLFLADPLDEASSETIRFMKDNGIDVKMVTGDNKMIAQRIAKDLKIDGKVIGAAETRRFCQDLEKQQDEFGGIAAFAEIQPKDKYEIVKAARINYIVASTGDGINDLPALRAANVGIAVAGAVTALKSMADIVLLGHGLSVIRDAILESRKIFVRLYNYSVYRISESFRLIVTILILGLWYGFYPLIPLQLILLAFLNDIPIISLAVDRVTIPPKPAAVNIKERLSLSLLYGLTGVLNSIFLFILMTRFFNFPLPVIQTMFFLKLTVSGHALIFVAHTKERWFKFLPAKEVIIATLSTQTLATVLAVTGFLMPARISFLSAAFVWIWALFWMQVSELMKDLQQKLIK